MEKIEQNWKVKIIKDNPTYPFIVIDDWYLPHEEKNVWKELDFYSSHDKIERAETSVVARDKQGNSLSKAYRFYPNEYYTERGMSKSHIQNYMYKQRMPKFHKILTDNCMPYARSFISSNRDATLMSYYEENDHYHDHHDTFLWTCLVWMVREPRLFNGGDFQFSRIRL